MALQASTTVRNAKLDAVESAIGTAPLLRLYSGAAPANPAAAASGTLLCEIALPSDWMSAAASGVKSKSGTWSGSGAVAAGAGTNVGHFRITESTGTTCHLQGTVTATGGGGDMTMDNISVASGQAVTVNTFALTEANA